MMESTKFFEIKALHDALTKQELNKRVKRTIRRHIRNTEWFDLVKEGSYVKLICLLTNRSSSTISAYFSEYEEVGIYNHKFPLIHLAQIAESFSVSLEYILGQNENDVVQSSTAKEYIQLYETYKNVDKLVVAANVRKFKGVNGIDYNTDIGKLLGISENTVKANISTGIRAVNNKFTIEQLYKLADAFEVKIDQLFQSNEEKGCNLDGK